MAEAPVRRYEVASWGGVSCVAVYRVYVLDEAGRVAGPPHILDCADDDEAALRARQYLDGQVVEVWAGARLVIALKPGSEPA